MHNFWSSGWSSHYPVLAPSWSWWWFELTGFKVTTQEREDYYRESKRLVDQLKLPIEAVKILIKRCIAIIPGFKFLKPHTSWIQETVPKPFYETDNSSTVELVSSSSNSSIRLIRHFSIGPGRIPIFCVHFCSSNSPSSNSSIYLIRHLFLSLRAFCSSNSSFAVSLLMSKQLVRMGIQTN